MPTRLRRGTSRTVALPDPVEVDRYFGPATLAIETDRGSWAPQVDGIGLGWQLDRGTIEAVLFDRDVRPTLPWWLRTSTAATLMLHGMQGEVSVPTVRRRGRRTVLRWPTRDPRIGGIVARVNALPDLFDELVRRPMNAEERAVLRDYLLSVADVELATWFA